MQDSTTKLIQRNFRQGGGKGAEAVGPFFSITVSGCYDLFACLRDIRRSTAPRGSRAFFFNPESTTKLLAMGKYGLYISFNYRRLTNWLRPELRRVWPFRVFGQYPQSTTVRAFLVGTLFIKVYASTHLLVLGTVKKMRQLIVN